MSICERMFEVMGFKGIKPAELCKKLGIPSNTVTNWSKRNTDPPAKYIVPICELLECSVWFLLTGEETCPPEPWLDFMDKELIELFRAQDYDDQKLILEHLRNWGVERKKTPAPEISKNGRKMLAIYEQMAYDDQLLLLGRLQEMTSPLLDNKQGEKAPADNGAESSSAKAM